MSDVLPAPRIPGFSHEHTHRHRQHRLAAFALGRGHASRRAAAAGRGRAAGRCAGDRRRLHRLVHGAAFAQGGRGRRRDRGDGAGLGRLGQQQRPGDTRADARRSGRTHTALWRGGRALRRADPRQRGAAVRHGARARDRGRGGADRLDPAGAYAGPRENRRGARSGDCARIGAGVSLDDGDRAAAGGGAPQRPVRAAGHVRHARRTLFLPLGRAPPSGERRR